MHLLLSITHKVLVRVDLVIVPGCHGLELDVVIFDAGVIVLTEHLLGESGLALGGGAGCAGDAGLLELGCVSDGGASVIFVGLLLGGLALARRLVASGRSLGRGSSIGVSVVTISSRCC